MSPLQTQPQAASSSPAQRKFANLQRKIEALRQTLQQWDQALPAFSQAHALRIPPLRAEHLQLQEQLLQRIEALLDGKGLNKSEREILSSLAAGHAQRALASGLLGEAQTDLWRRRHDAHAEVDLDTQEREELEALRAQLARASGLDLDDIQAETAAELLRETHRRLDQAQAQAEAAAPAPQPKRKSSAAQRKKEAAAAAAQAQVQQSLRTVFRKLASALHPDRASDSADQKRRTELMQRVNEAYGREDLLALYALQLEIEQVDPAHIAQATTAQLGHFTQMLQQQHDELELELKRRQISLCRDFDLEPRSAPQPDKLGKLLDEAVRDERTEIQETRRELLNLRDRDTARRWLAQLREQQRALERMGYFS
ncbi:pyruvate/2-oxoglutarate dehydrogenase complex dihydrolipoamide acyltransferase (E2) component [Inhella inkyongensis]|uniref:Pyruvate/2-oxoglutarate dehydrogenase complex dihydrolipoamide acyltransferase (E2) component n=1 Tax=Inhella inkyongensis TaxID=392593 RepID=A0A840S523_9BURK|nr:J domain-containing protein [Inhella inkyongensis]MBB5204578.1 pyruvate/2-oxoglutarate dehydrogenase complex dihydrolipoamide acyltransferase (E2) component [Inhella inkyongensis]